MKIIQLSHRLKSWENYLIGCEFTRNSISPYLSLK